MATNINAETEGLALNSRPHAVASQEMQRVSAETRSYGGRRTGFMTAQERERAMILEDRLLGLARQALRRQNGNS
jgi:hypothetical protein